MGSPGLIVVITIRSVCRGGGLTVGKGCGLAVGGGCGRRTYCKNYAKKRGVIVGGKITDVLI